MIPYSEVFFTEAFICLLGRLTPQLVTWMRSDLDWDVHMIGRGRKNLSNLIQTGLTRDCCPG